MSRSIIAGLIALGLVGCSAGDAKEAPAGDAAQPVASTPAASSPSAPVASSRSTRTRSSGEDRPQRTGSSNHAVAQGTSISATIDNALSSRTSKPGESFRATVSRDVTDDRGNVAIPAGSAVTLTIVQLEPGSDQVRPEGRLVLDVSSVQVNGTNHAVTAELSPVSHSMKGRGVTTDEAARVGAGAAIGALAGQLIGKNTKGTEIGGAVGAVAGGAVAVKYAYRDIIIAAGTPITFTLTQALIFSAR